MGWEKDGRYYTRSRREGGRVVREYVGGGTLGELAARLDAIDRQTRVAKREAARAAREEVNALDDPLAELDELADLLMAAALTAADYRQHNRGDWRKRRVKTDDQAG